MKYFCRLNSAATLILLLLFIGGCGKEVISGFKPEGRSLGQATSYQNDESLLGEESLSSVGNGDMYGANPEMQSDEYKKKFGRSTAPLLPIYFDFDRDTIRDDQIERLEKNGIYLQGNPAKRIMIAGNCDERGTSEYNMGLGERRAITAKRYLINAGIAEDRIRTVSFGDEMPLFPGSDEWSWSQNRRDDFVIE